MLRYLFGSLILIAVAIPVVWGAWQLFYVWLAPDVAALLGAFLAGLCLGGAVMESLTRKRYSRNPAPEVFEANRRERPWH